MLCMFGTGPEYHSNEARALVATFEEAQAELRAEIGRLQAQVTELGARIETIERGRVWHG